MAKFRPSRLFRRATSARSSDTVEGGDSTSALTNSSRVTSPTVRTTRDVGATLTILQEKSLAAEKRLLEDKSAEVDELMFEQPTPVSEEKTDGRLPVSEEADSRRPSISIVDSANADIVHTLLAAPPRQHRHTTSGSTTLPTSAALDYFTPGLPDITVMLHRKVWVRRRGASATLVQIKDDDMVDDVRDMILKKYANSLGRTFDAPDMTLRIANRVEQGQHRQERTLGPEEEMCRTIDRYYPGGQTVDEALIIDMPIREERTPRPSPRPYQHPGYHALDDSRPLENGTDYFPPMPAVIPPGMPQTSGSHDGRMGLPLPHAHHPTVAGPLEPHQRSISVLNTGQVPPLPSPGGTSRRGHREHRPKYHRQHTSSPTIITHPSQAQQHHTAAQQQLAGQNVGVVTVGPPVPHNPMNLNPAHPLVHRPSNRPRNDSLASDAHQHPVTDAVPAAGNAAPQPPTPPVPVDGLGAHPAGSAPPTPSQVVIPVQGQRPSRPRKNRKPTPEKPSSRSRGPGQQRNNSQADGGQRGFSISSVLDGSVPPINVLIVEDNIINLRILEGLMKRLKVRWQTAMNGQIAVDKWRGGGYHLVLMDIQMPVMNGLQATKEIRRLERVNGIGVFSSTESGQSSPVEKQKGDAELGEDMESGRANGDTAGQRADLERTKSSKENDKLASGENLFKSPVIIVALTASSLQSDRHEALAAGCNDFLTKPVNFVWLERKVKEWGCMQALIDFDGWRKWKDYAAKEEESKSEAQREEERKKEEKEKVKMEKLAKLQEKQRLKKEEDERKKMRQSLNSSEAGTAATGSGANGESGHGGVNGSASEA